MNVKTEVLSKTACDPSEARSYVASHPAAQLYHTASWRNVIARETGGSSVTVVARNEAGEIIGWMPLFMKQGPIGVIANSSPFFGSHGGILANDSAAFDAILKTAIDYLREQNVLTLNVIHPLKDRLSDRYVDVARVVGGVVRVAHVKKLQGDREALFDSLAGLTRSNLRRKCWKSGIAVERDESENAIALLLRWHCQQMLAMGVQPKSRSFFEMLLHGREGDGVEGRLYVGRIGGEPVAALFVCAWRDWIEYLTPAFDVDHRSVQPLTAVIFEAMLDCARDGFKLWNFGGSGKNLTGVKAFKETWNGENIDYRYFVIETGCAETVMRYAGKNGNRGYEGYFLYPF